ncbi:MAG: polyprenyl synthetase family protein [Propionibacteriaceae bacterium]|nr:polyprenyl synthetase family protein [Propionibacteriaceae bacterium]
MSWNPALVTDEIDADFASSVSDFIEEIEERLVEIAKADTAFASEAAGHIIASGGKRFRPLIVVTASFLGQAKRQDVINAALVVELTHAASLYHDDVMDEAPMRRGVPSANQLWGNLAAILAGDLLFSRASAAVIKLGMEYVKVQTATFARLVQGQLSETVGPTPQDDPLEHYLKVVADKTGSLIATSALFGGMVAKLPQEQLTALAKFGEEIGILFQLSDDIIDITSDEAGKKPGADLRAKIPTLPILLLRKDAREEDQKLRELLSGDLSDDAALANVLDLLRQNWCMEAARLEVQARSALARSYLEPLPDGHAKRALEALCDAVATRTT